MQQGRPNQSAESRHRPIIPLVAGFAAGIALDEFCRPHLLWWLVPGFALAAAAAWNRWGDRLPAANWILAALALVPVGGAHHLLSFRHRPPNHLSRMAPDEPTLYRLKGTVEREPRRHYAARDFPHSAREPRTFWVLRVQVRAVSGGGGEWVPAAGGVSVFCGARPAAVPGDRVRLVGELERNSPPRNPGRPHMARRYERMGSFATVSADAPGAVQVTGRAPWWDPWTAVGRLRTALEERLLWRGEPLVDGLTAALVFGHRGRIGPRTARLFRSSGLVHFLAISGLHVGLFAGLVVTLLLIAGVRPWVRAGSLIAVVWLYVCFTGAHTAALRAGCMVTLAAAAPLLGRRHDMVSALAAAAFIILLVEPTQLFNAGFQLSFAAVWALLYLYNGLSRILWPWSGFLQRAQDAGERSWGRDARVWARSALLLSFCAWFATAPLNAAHFRRISLLAPFLYVLLWPLVVPLLVCALGVAGLCLAGLPVGWAAAAAGFFSGNITELLRLASALPGFVHFTPGPPWWWVGLFYAGVGLWLWRRRVWGGRRALLALAVGLAVSYMAVDFAGRRPGRFRMTVMDVGHGSAVAMRTPEGRTVMYDAGSFATSRRRAVAHFLWSRRVRSMDALVLSHRNLDHCSMVPYLARRFGIRKILLPPPPPQQRRMGRLLGKSLTRHGLEATHVTSGTLLAGGDLSLRCLHPGPRFGAGEDVSANDRSLVLKGRYDRLTFLLTGDLQRPGLKRLMERHGGKLEADVLVLPHHGEWSPAVERLVELASPRIAVASSGSSRDLQETARALREKGIPLWTTPRDGAVTAALRGQAVTVEGFVSGRRQVYPLR